MTEKCEIAMRSSYHLNGLKQLIILSQSGRVQYHSPNLLYLNGVKSLLVPFESQYECCRTIRIE